MGVSLQKSSSDNRSVSTVCSVDAYLERMNYDGPLDKTVNTLDCLQEAHVQTVPYENLDIIAGKKVSIDLPDVYDKIVNRRRGGYCFELNGLFGWLLRELGFDVTEYYGRFLDGEALAIPMRRHRVLRVLLDDQVYICDVGVGIPAPRRTLLLAENLVQQQNEESYRIVRHPELGWVVEYFRKEKWNRLYCFTEDPQFPIDFEMPHHWCMTHPDSIFRNYTQAYIRTPEGRRTIADVIDEEGNKAIEFREFSPDGVKTFIPRTEEEYRHSLEDFFGIVLD